MINYNNIFRLYIFEQKRRGLSSFLVSRFGEEVQEKDKLIPYLSYL